MLFQLDFVKSLQMFSPKVVCYTIITLYVLRCIHSTTLTVSNKDTLENTDVTLSCTNNGNALGSLQWKRNNGEEKGAMHLDKGTCSSGGFVQNASYYAIDCTDGTVYLLTIKKISRQFNGNTFTCGGFAGNPESNIVTIFVKVPVKSLTISPYSQQHSSPENSTFTLQCTTSECRPEPKFLWIKYNNVVEVVLSQTINVNDSAQTIKSYTNPLSIKLTRELNGWYIFCTAANYNGTPFASDKILLNVTYPPEVPVSIGNGSEVRVLQNDIVYLECSATGGNPLPVLKWNRNNESPQYLNGHTIAKPTSWQASGRDPVEMICQSWHLIRNDYAYITVNILYPPDPPEITIQTYFGDYELVDTTLFVIEGRPFKLNCSTQSNPPATLFKWNDLVATNNSTFYSSNVDNLQTKKITCIVSNYMQFGDSRPSLTGNNQTHLELIVLYPPKVNVLRNKTIIEGENLTYSCNFTVGNPSVTNITWSWQNNKWDTHLLQINNVTRNEAGVYTCTVNNLMISSDKIQQRGEDFGTFDLSVQYKTKVLELIINNNETDNVTVYENQAVNISCEIEGNPSPTGELFRQSLSGFYNTQAEEVLDYQTVRNSTNMRLTHYFLAQCTHTGIHECRARNKLHTGETSSSNKSITLFVKCNPRKSPFFTTPDTVISPTSVDITLNFIALAYPIPPKSGYIWTRNIATTDTWVNITASGHKTIITTLGLQSNLTIKDVSEFDYGKYMIVIVNDVGQYNHTFNLLSARYTENESTPSTSASLGITGIAAGIPSGVILIVAVIIIAIVYKRRLLYKKKDESGQYIGLTTQNEKHMALNVCDQNTAASNDHEQLPALPGRHPARKADVHGLQDVDDYDDKTDYAVYGNAFDKIMCIKRLEVEELFPYLMDRAVQVFAAEYMVLPQGLTKPYEFSQKPENIALNRYRGIYPYDHSRVKIPNIPEFFINASYIDGYKKKKAYIASLGPLSRTTDKFVMFWKMVWSEKSDAIVMLTKLTEPSGVKCEQYWPKEGTSVTYGEITVTSVGEDVYSDYVMRKFTVLKGSQKRNLIQFHFMAWPDKSIPDDVTCLLEFRRRVRANHSSGPTIVHCSAGIGRTGTYIAIDILIEEGKSKGSVNVLECVKTMREQRANLVQTVEQYYYIYKTLVNALAFDSEAVPAEKINKYADMSKKGKFNDMFKKFNLSVESENTQESNARTVNKVQKDKNRAGSDIPGDAHRVRLVLNRGMDASDYVNAVYINSFKVADHFIVAQSPLLTGVEDFLYMIYQEKCTCVVSMDGEHARQTVGVYMPSDDAKFTFGSFKVQCSRLESKETYIVRKIKLELTGQLKGVERIVYHFQFLGWFDGNKVPNDPQQFVEFTEDVEKFECQFGTEGSHVLVHCLNAFERSCLFCAVVSLCEKIKYEKEVCVPNTLRQIRTRRKLAIPTLEQFQFCYQAADAYINMQKKGNNNADNSYMNMTIS